MRGFETNKFMVYEWKLVIFKTNKRNKGRTWHHCLVEKCGYKTHVQDRMKKHEEKHTKDSPINNYETYYKSCLRFIARKEFWKLAKKHNSSLKMFKALVKDFI